MLPDEIDNQPFFKAIWENALELIVLTDRNRNIISLNPAASIEFGYDIDEIAGKNASVLYQNENEYVRVGENLLANQNSHDFSNGEVCYRRKNGSSFLGHAKGAPVFNEIGDIIGYFIMVSDLSEIRVIEKERDDQKKSLERVGLMAKVGSWRYDSSDKRVYWSDIISEMTGLLNGENGIFFDDVLRVIHEDDRAPFRHHVEQSISDHLSFSLETKIIRPDGELRYMIFEGDVECDRLNPNHLLIFGSCMDITALRKKDEALYESMKLMDFVMDTIPVRVFWKDVNSRYLGCNQPFAQDAGCDHPEQVVGKTDHDLFGQECSDVFVSDDREIMSSGVSRKFFEEPQIREDGSMYWLQTSKMPLKNLDGKTIGVVGTYEDITVRKEKEQRLALTHYCVEQVKSAVFWCLSDGTFFYVNQTACEWLGFSREELLSMTIAEINPELTEDIWCERWREMKQYKIIHRESFYQRKDGDVFPVELYLNHVEYGAQEYSILFVFDITNRKQAEEKLKAYQDNLEHLVEERTVALQTMNQELEAFAYSMSHDLRAPLRGIDGFGQALIEDYHDLLDEDGKHYLNRIRVGTQKMATLIDDILKLIRISRSHVSCQFVDLHEVISRIIEELKAEDINRGLAVEIDSPIEVWADHALFSTAMYNVISNAWKYSSKKPESKISIRSKIDDEEYIIVVQDNGAGFDMKYADNLFSPFSRLHCEDDFEGNGIGLAMVDRIVRKHGGSIWAESEIDKGACFYISLPLKK